MYFCIPLVVGKIAYDWTMVQNHRNWKVDEKTGKVILPQQVAERKDELARNKVQAQVILNAVKKEAQNV